jgi:hypothetical protein
MRWTVYGVPMLADVTDQPVTTTGPPGGPEGELHGGEHHRGAGLVRTAISAVREVAQAIDDS